MISNRMFDPWVGPRYTSEGLDGMRLLVLGESHYGSKSDEEPTFTYNIIRRLARVEDRPGRYYSVTATLLLDLPSARHLSLEARRDFWDRVAFYNYVQTFPGETAGIRPTLEMWEAAQEPFLSTLGELDPHVVVVTGKELDSHVPRLPAHMTRIVIPHPSRAFSYSKWGPDVHNQIRGARERLGL